MKNESQRVAVVCDPIAGESVGPVIDDALDIDVRADFIASRRVVVGTWFRLFAGQSTHTGAFDAAIRELKVPFRTPDRRTLDRHPVVARFNRTSRRWRKRVEFAPPARCAVAFPITSIDP